LTARGAARVVLVGALPLVLEAVSPQRVTVSIVIAAFYVVAALVLARPRMIDRPVLIYAGVAIAFVGLSLFRMETIDPLNAAQRAYGLSKATYYMEVAIPLAVAVALLVSSLNDLKPAVVVFMFIGVIIALATVVLHDAALFGAARYAVQGNLIAIAGLLACQFWILRDLRIVVAVQVLCVIGIVITQSRQSIAAYAIGLAFTGVYWFAADRVRAAAGKASRLAQMWALPAVGYGLLLVAVLVWAALILQPWIHMPKEIKDPVTCNCIVGRLVDVTINPGGRNILIEQGWALFVGHPFVGAGLGAFVGLAPYPYPHNIPLEVAGEMGLLGVLVLLVPLVVGWVRLTLAGIRAASPAVAAAVIIVVVYVVVANLSGDLASERGLWVFGLVLLKLGWRRNPAEVAGEARP
jgi:hypothetical protein